MLWPLVLLGGTAALAMNFQTLLPLFARTLGIDAEGYGALFAAIGVGALIGSLGLAFMASQRPMKGLILGGAAAFLALTFALGFARSPMVAFPLVIGIGLASMLMINTINVTIQNAVPDALRGRVMALYVTVFAGTAPIGGLLAGALAQAFGAPSRSASAPRWGPACSRWSHGTCVPSRRRPDPSRCPHRTPRGRSTRGMTVASPVVSMSNFPEA